MDSNSLLPFFLILGFLVMVSAFFSASETAMMTLNRYRLDNMAAKGHRSARLAQMLLNHPDRMLSTILLGNNVANLSAASVASIIALKTYGEAAIAFSGFLLTFIVLVFAEIAPKTLAATHPERIAFPAVYVLYGLQKLFYDWIPLIRLINFLGILVLKPFGITPSRGAGSLSTEELRMAVLSSGSRMSRHHRDMLLQILELDTMTVDDLMVPRNEIEAIDLDDEWDNILEQLATSHHTRLPVYHQSLDNVRGIIHLRHVLHLRETDELNAETLESIIRSPYFIPEGSHLLQQLLNLQRNNSRFGLVVDEYGDLKGLITVDEILEEVVGEFGGAVTGFDEDAHRQEDGSYLVRGTASIRDINKKFGWSLPTDGPKTLNGLILETMESIPEPGTQMMLSRHPMEIIQKRGTIVSVVKIHPPEPQEPENSEQSEE